jgi:RHS repeat-associated protein
MGLVSRVDSGGAATYYGFDAIGNTSELIDGGSNVVSSYAYLPFGGLLASSESFDDPFQYVGERGVMDDGDGLLFMRARYLDPSIGRFLQADPVGVAAGPNLYTYSHSNPVSWVDPSGLTAEYQAWLTKQVLAIPWTARMQQVRTILCKMPGVGGLETLVSQLFGVSPATLQKHFYSGAKGIPWVTSLPALPALPTPVIVGAKVVGYLGAALLSFGLGYISGTAIRRVAPRVDQVAEDMWFQLDQLFDGALFGVPPTIYYESDIVYPSDPNEKVGPPGQVEATDRLDYIVYFENVSSATAPAQEVVVEDYLDEDLDWSTVQLGEVAFGDTVVTASGGGADLQATVMIPDYRPQVSEEWEVQIEGHLDAQTGRILWTFRTLDPSTGDWPEDALAGFLPPNDDTHRGEGHVTFSVLPRQDLPPATWITNKALIVFDTEASIETNVVSTRIGGLYVYHPLVLR